MKLPVRIAITGAAGQIAYSLIFRIASGELLGPEQPISLHLLEVSAALESLQGTIMELEDCAYPLLQDVIMTDDATIAFSDVEYAFLLGAKPRAIGMERSDLVRENGKIFIEQGRALNDFANRDVKVLIVGNPANTNAYIAMHSAPELEPTQFSAMTRLDQHRAFNQLAIKTGVEVTDVEKVIIWGNHSSTQYPDIHYATVNGVPAMDLVDEGWILNEFTPTIQQRGAEVIKVRGKSSAASAAHAAISHMRDWALGTDQWVSMVVISDGSYGITEGLMYSFPVTIQNGHYTIVKDLDIKPFSRERLVQNQQELEHEKDMIMDLLA